MGSFKDHVMDCLVRFAVTLAVMLPLLLLELKYRLVQDGLGLDPVALLIGLLALAYLVDKKAGQAIAARRPRLGQRPRNTTVKASRVRVAVARSWRAVSPGERVMIRRLPRNLRRLVAA